MILQSRKYLPLFSVMILSFTSCKGQVESIRLPRHVNDTVGIDLSAKYECTTKEWPIPYSYANSACSDTVIVTFDSAEYKVMLDIYMRDGYPVDIWITVVTDSVDYDKYVAKYCKTLRLKNWNLMRTTYPNVYLDTPYIIGEADEFRVGFFDYVRGNYASGKNRIDEHIVFRCVRKR